jgi:hypothetical protein
MVIHTGRLGDLIQGYAVAQALKSLEGPLAFSFLLSG